MECRKCGGDCREEITPKMTHYGQWVCQRCNKHNGWIPKPSSDSSKYRRPTSQTGLVKKYSRGFCEMCLTQRDELPDNQTLEAQHVIPFQQGGTNQRANIWIVCTSCHRMIEHQRTYHGAKVLPEVLSTAKAITSWSDE